MFGLFRSEPTDDPDLGRLQRSGGIWRGRVVLAEAGETSLLVEGGRGRPDEECLALARDLRHRYPDFIPAIRNALFEHREPYREQSYVGPAAGKMTEEASIGDQVRLLGVLVERLRGMPTATIGFAAAWDEEHTLGAVIQNGTFVELNGSIRDVFG